MSLGAEKAALMGAAGGGISQYFGDGSLGDCQFGASSITQSGDSVAIDTVLTTGSESGGPGSNPYGSGVNNSSACYCTTVLNKSGSYDGDMWVGNFKDLTIDASVTLTTDQPTRGMLIYVDGDCVINGSLSMTARGGFSDPTTSGGSDSSAVSSTGIRLPMLTSGGSDTLAAADFAGCGDAAVAAVENQVGIASDGTIFTISRVGGTGGAARTIVNSNTNLGGLVGANGATGAATISTGGGGSGGSNSGGSGTVTSGAGGDGGCFSGGSGGGGAGGNANVTAPSGGDYGGAGGSGNQGGGGYGSSRGGGGSGNPGGRSGGYTNAQSGVGGLIILIVSGDLTIGSGGGIFAHGTNGGTGYDTGSGRYGGGSGGGAIMVLYVGTLSNSGSITSTNGVSQDGTGNGGVGGVHTAQVSA